jgi:hypothetical protein
MVKLNEIAGISESINLGQQVNLLIKQGFFTQVS